VPECPAEGVVDPLSGAGLRRQILGHCATGDLIVGSIAMSTGLPFYYRHRAGTKPGPGKFDRPLREFINRCWKQQTRKPDAAKYHKINNAGVFGCAHAARPWQLLRHRYRVPPFSTLPICATQ